jgi:peptidoglycan/LPS O-acetylase OafA/YrhL
MTRDANHTRSPIDLAVLDALRGLAALYVVLHHAEWLLWAPVLSGRDTNIGHRILLAFSSSLLLGHQAVLVFFLISGFCIHYRQARRLAVEARPRTARWWLPLNVRSYAERRLRRLCPPLLAALVLTAVLDQVGAHINPEFYAGRSPIDSINISLIGVGDHSWLTFLGNLGLQSSLAVPTFGTNSPLWSLSYEFWYYALYPVALIATVRFGARGLLGLTGAISAAALGWVLVDSSGSWEWIGRVLTYWVVWTGGALIAEAYTGRIHLRNARLLGPFAASMAVLSVVVLTVNSLHPRVRMEQHVEDLLWSLAFAVLLAWAMLACPKVLTPLVQRVAARLGALGNMSYTLYVVHMPWLALVSSWWLSTHADLPDGILLAAVGVAGALGLAAACWFLVERHCVSPRRQGDSLAAPVPEKQVFGPVVAIPSA